MSLRILVIPAISTSELESSSDFRVFRGLVAEIVQKRSDVMFVFAVPRSVQRSQLPSIERVHWYHYDEGNYCFYDGEKILKGNFLDVCNERIGMVPLDAVWTNRMGLVAVLAGMLPDARATEQHTPVISFEFQSLQRGSPLSTRPDADLVCRAMGYVLGWPVFSNEGEKMAAMELVGQYMSGAMAQRFAEKAAVQLQSFVFDEWSTLAERQPKGWPEPLRLCYSGRINPNKRVDELLGLFEYLRAAGRKVEVTILTADRSGGKLKMVKKLCPFANVLQGLPREEYMRQLVSQHAFVVDSIAETTPNVWLEMTAGGVVGIWPRKRPYTRQLLGSLADEYPLQFANWPEAFGLIDWIREHYDEAREWNRRLSEEVRARAGARSAAEWHADFIRDVVSKCEAGYLWGGDGVFADVYENTLAVMPDEFSLAGFLEIFRMGCRSVTRKDLENPYFRGMPTRYGTYKWLKTRCQDLLNGPEPVFRRIRDGRDKADAGVLGGAGHAAGGSDGGEAQQSSEVGLAGACEAGSGD